jgi:hypothetical protein
MILAITSTNNRISDDNRGHLFANYVLGTVRYLRWSDTMSPEVGSIRDKLVELNNQGFISAVNLNGFALVAVWSQGVSCKIPEKIYKAQCFNYTELQH